MGGDAPQLIPTRGRKVLPAVLPIRPSVKPAFLEITLLGLRNLSPSGFIKLQRPQVGWAVVACDFAMVGCRVDRGLAQRPPLCLLLVWIFRFTFTPRPFVSAWATVRGASRTSQSRPGCPAHLTPITSFASLWYAPRASRVVVAIVSAVCEGEVENAAFCACCCPTWLPWLGSPSICR
jgi:hypothetical protein